MKIVKKTLSLFLSLVMLLSVMAGIDLSTYAGISEYYEYTVLNDGTAEITGYTYLATELTIPSKLNGYTVTCIGEKAFYLQYSLTSVRIPNTVTSIGNRAFSYCSKLTSVTLPDSVTSIGDNAFWNCISLTNIDVPDSVISIGVYAFADCNLLTNLNVNINNKNYSSQDGVLFNKDKTILIQYPIGNTRNSYAIPNSVKSIGQDAFRSCKSLINVTIPNSVTSMEWGAFYSCESLKDVTIPDSITSIDDYVFNNCKSLTNVTIPDSITSIGIRAFSYCDSLTNVTISDSVTNIAWGVFLSCVSLTGVNVDINNQNYSSQNGVLFNKEKTTLIQYPIGNTRTSYTIPDRVTSINLDAFYNCSKLTSVTIPNSVTSISDSAFGGCCSLTNINVDTNNHNYLSHNGVLFNKEKTTLIQYPIGNTRTSYIIPDSVTSINSYAFRYCTSLTSITIPDSVTSIGNYAFANCKSLTSINVDSNNKKYSSQDGVLFNKDKTTLIQYPIGNTRTSYTIPNNVTSIGAEAFSNCNFTSIAIPDSVTSIGSYAFSDCKLLTSLTISSIRVITIWKGAFSNCDLLKDIYYTGSKAQWNRIIINDFNGSLANASIHYNHVHSYENADIMEPTCTKTGSKTYICTECGSLIVETIQKFAHNFNSSGVCQNCGYSSPNISLNETKTINIANGGDQEYLFFIPETSGTYIFYSTGSNDTYGYLYDSDMKQIASDDDDGEGTNFSITYELEANNTYFLGVKFYDSSKTGNINVTLSHTHNFVPGEVVAPTCTEEGYTIYTCTCGTTENRNFVDATGHSWNSGTVTKSATCTADGVRTFTCRNCTAQKTETIKKTGHTYNSRVTSPTCTQEGYTTHTCTQCGDSYVSNYASATGHSWNSGIVTKNATCTADGVRTYTCTVCGEKYTESIPKLGHNYDAVITSPTCTQGGYTTHTCTRCGDAYTDSNTQAKGHNWNSGTVTKSATCTADGVRTFTCRNCSAQKIEPIKKTGHTYNSRTTTPTCTQEGYTTYTCRYCNNTYKDNITPAKGHSWDNGAVTKDATYMYDGEKTFTCTACGEKYIEIIPKTGNAYKVTLSKTSYLYDGKVKTPKVTVKDGNGQKLSPNQYTVSYPKGRKQIGQYIITVKIKSSGASIKTAFTIKPKKTSFKSVKSTKKGVVEATWSKVSGISGYNIQYKSNSQRGWKSGNVSKSKNGAVIKKAKSGAKVSIRVRTYKTVKVNGKSQKIYSDWSKTKTVKVK